MAQHDPLPPEGLHALLSHEPTARWLVRRLVTLHGAAAVDAWCAVESAGATIADISYEIDGSSVVKRVGGRRSGTVGGRRVAEFLSGYAGLGAPKTVDAADFYLILTPPRFGKRPIDSQLRTYIHHVNQSLGGRERVFEGNWKGRYRQCRPIPCEAVRLVREVLPAARTPAERLDACRRILGRCPNSVAAAMVVARQYAQGGSPVPADLLQQAALILRGIVVRIDQALEHLGRHRKSSGPRRADQIEQGLQRRRAVYERLLDGLASAETGGEPEPPAADSSDRAKVDAFCRMLRHRTLIDSIVQGCINTIRAQAVTAMRDAHAGKETHPLSVAVVAAVNETVWPRGTSTEQRVDETIAVLLEMLRTDRIEVPQTRSEIAELFGARLRRRLSDRARLRRRL